MELFLEIYLLTLTFIFGASIGSFLNVVIYRLPKGNFWESKRSYCPNCKELIKPYDLIPVLSYLILGGKCRNCKQKISARYIAVEFFTGLMALAVVWRFGFAWEALLSFAVIAVCIVITMIDFDIMEIPDEMVIVMAVLAVISIFVMEDVTLLQRLIGFFIISLPMLLLALAIPSAFGGGDIKLIAVCGALLGFKNVLVAMFIALLLGGNYAVYLILSKKREKASHIAFGPYICAGVVAVLFWGKEILTWYLGFYI